jgi:colanic acid/amylovoran biosynthesis glycosyltransferase
MKGVNHLVETAAILRDQALPFEMHIWGGGSLEGELREGIRAKSLENHVKLEGTVPFAELSQRVKEQIDLFVCPHPQGDPSCTYLETLSCAVPIVAFDNDAWRGLTRRCGAGWSSPIGDPKALADVITRIDRDRDALVEHAQRSLAFAREHTFEVTFERRMEHLRRIAAPSPIARAGE